MTYITEYLQLITPRVRRWFQFRFRHILIATNMPLRVALNTCVRVVLPMVSLSIGVLLCDRYWFSRPPCPVRSALRTFFPTLAISDFARRSKMPFSGFLGDSVLLLGLEGKTVVIGEISEQWTASLWVFGKTRISKSNPLPSLSLHLPQSSLAFSPGSRLSSNRRAAGRVWTAKGEVELLYSLKALQSGSG